MPAIVQRTYFPKTDFVNASLDHWQASAIEGIAGYPYILPTPLVPDFNKRIVNMACQIMSGTIVTIAGWIELLLKDEIVAKLPFSDSQRGQDIPAGFRWTVTSFQGTSSVRDTGMDCLQYLDGITTAAPTVFVVAANFIDCTADKARLNVSHLAYTAGTEEITLAYAIKSWTGV